MRYLVFSLLLVFLTSCAPRATISTPVASTVSGQASTRAQEAGLEPFVPEPLSPEARWIVAVPNFSVRSHNVRLRGSELTGRDESFFGELGSGVADIFVNEAFRSGQFRITERTELNAILFEQDFAASGRVDPQTAAEVGRVTGAELLVLGSVVEFGVTSVGGSGRILGIFGGSAETVTARVTVDIRFVNAVTAEIIAIGSSTSEVSQSNISLDVLNVLRGLQAGRTGTTIVDLAVRNAIIGAINDATATLPRKVTPGS